MSAATPERDALAAELVLGVLTGEELAAAEALAQSDPAFANAVERWRQRFAAFDRSAAVIVPSGGLWTRIETAIDATPRAGESISSLETSRAAALRQQGRLPLSSSEAASDARRRIARWLWNSLPAWRLWAAVATAALVIVAAVLNFELQRARSAPVLVAILQTEDNRPAAVVNAFADGRTELVPLTSFTVPAGRVLEVWTLWDRQVGPRSVGLLQAMATARLRLDQLPLGPDQLFEITLEPAGGSPTGRPTGPILAIGRTARAL